MPGGVDQSHRMSNGDCGSGARREQLAGQCRKGCARTPRIRFRGGSSSWREGTAGLWRFLGSKWRTGSSLEHLGVQGRDRAGGWRRKKASGLSQVLLAKADLFLFCPSLHLCSPILALCSFQDFQLNCGGISLFKLETKIQPYLTYCDAPANRGGLRETKVTPDNTLEAEMAAHS